MQQFPPRREGCRAPGEELRIHHHGVQCGIHGATGQVVRDRSRWTAETLAETNVPPTEHQKTPVDWKKCCCVVGKFALNFEATLLRDLPLVSQIPKGLSC